MGERIIPPILKCPSTRGEEWPADSFKSYVSTDVKFITHDEISFTCPAGHTFTLRKAVQKGMFTPEEALRMIAKAQAELPGLKEDVKEARRWFRRKK
jgi:hypothetical protein